MKALNIYVRQDLKMRKGKMAAQAAHAAMKLLFEVMYKPGTQMILPTSQRVKLEEFLSKPVINISMVQNEEELSHALASSKPNSIIIDSGRTEFHGVPTVTCGASGIFSEHRHEEFDVKKIYGKDIKAKQLFVFSKDAPLSKESACQLSVLTCLMQLYQKMKTDNEQLYFDLSEESAFSDWINNAFAKIAVCTKTLEELKELTHVLEKSDISFVQYQMNNNSCICIEPSAPDKIDKITGHLSLI